MDADLIIIIIFISITVMMMMMMMRRFIECDQFIHCRAHEHINNNEYNHNTNDNNSEHAALVTFEYLLYEYTCCVFILGSIYIYSLYLSKNEIKQRRHLFIHNNHILQSLHDPSLTVT